mmetsp:Transcript_14165/g.30787  ORF Transcript_14165/g.30787 Transcript_14165/m.30787 type:complete len:273 (-) Transcript_14165:85-903(-)|eukprot:CAMPEP_0172327072 /NCGR_PEP_ID=MMETSP1058-20130122/58499_1 /TAXON_ID=83371 /ORGANISM="Detonula confervacea, Strain CCMP 353" /LENGTH=272 /DNA_ID=CAMNT_0013044013 /DNA_START=204 /DNA_END=1022 /DNA_ORIENTATION=+
MYTTLIFCFRGDSIEYLTQSVQNHVVDTLKKALAAANHRWYLEISPGDLRSVDVMSRDNAQYLGLQVDYLRTLSCFDNFLYMEVVGADTRRLVIRALAYQTGIVKISDETFPLIWREILLSMANMVFGVVPPFVGMSLDPWEDMSCEEYEALTLEHGDLRIKYSPSYEKFMSSIKLVIVPGQIKTVAVMRGMKPLLGFEELGCDGWATGNGRTKNEEIEEAINQYKRSHMYRMERDEIINDVDESDGDYVDVGESDSESAGSHELDSSYEDD